MEDTCTTFCSSFPGRVVSTYDASRAARNIQVQVFVWTYVLSFLFCIYLGVEFLSHRVLSNFLRNCQAKFTTAGFIHFLPLHNSCLSNDSSTLSRPRCGGPLVNLAPGQYVEATSLRLKEHQSRHWGGQPHSHPVMLTTHFG